MVLSWLTKVETLLGMIRFNRFYAVSPSRILVSSPMQSLFIWSNECFHLGLSLLLSSPFHPFSKTTAKHSGFLILFLAICQDRNPIFSTLSYESFMRELINNGRKGSSPICLKQSFVHIEKGFSVYSDMIYTCFSCTIRLQ